MSKLWIKPRKRFGQNFLQDVHIINRIIQTIDPHYEDHFVEIGPGLGALTAKILPLVKSMDAVEIDRDLIISLQTLCQSLGNLTIYNADALTFNFAALMTHEKPLRVIGNLPYNISTPLLFHLMTQTSAINDMYFMLQKEVVDRLAAHPGHHDYGRLSVMIQYECQVKALFNVPPTAFKPKPKVDSAFVRLIPHLSKSIIATNPSVFHDIIKQAFQQRRKMLRNCLKSWITSEQLMSLNIDPQARPENLTVENFVRISNIVSA